MNNEREQAAQDEEDVSYERETFLEALQMRVWDLRCWVRRIARNLFWSREALARREEAMQREQLEILLNAHGHALTGLLTPEERARAEKLMNPDNEAGGNSGRSIRELVKR